MNHDDFQRELHRLRARGRRRRRQVKAQAAVPTSRALAAFDARERLEDIVLPVLADVRETCPELVLSRRCQDGAWVLSLAARVHHPDRPRRRPGAIHRFEVAFAADLSGAAHDLHFAATAWDRDLPGSLVRVAFTDGAGVHATLATLLEEAALRFVTAVLAGPPPEDPGRLERRLGAEARSG